MKHNLLKFSAFALVAGFMFVMSCKKDDETTTTYNQKDLIGTWMDVNTNDSGCNDLYEITETEVKNYSSCSQVKSTSSYTFNGTALSYEMIFKITDKIKSVSSQTLTIEREVLGEKETIIFTRYAEPVSIVGKWQADEKNEDISGICYEIVEFLLTGNMKVYSTCDATSKTLTYTLNGSTLNVGSKGDKSYVKSLTSTKLIIAETSTSTATYSYTRK